jgi:hypothetical protein
VANLAAIPLVGFAIGMSIATAMNQMPFAFTFLAWLFLLMAVWQGIDVISFGLLGAAFGAIIGAMANVVPYMFVELAWVAAFFSVKLVDWVNSSKLVSATSRAEVYPASCKRLAVISPTPGMLSSER